MIKKTIVFVILFIFLIPSLGAASEDTSAFRKYKDIKNLNISVPTVVEVPINDIFLQRTEFAVVDKKLNKYLPYYYKKNIDIGKIPYSITTNPSVSNSYRMTDGNLSTYKEFELDKDDFGMVTLNIKSHKLITSSKLIINLDDNIALPTSIEIKAVVNNSIKKVIAKKSMHSQTITFPEITSRDWKITFEYSQLLRISELRLVQKNLIQETSQFVRFLAQPNTDYRLYLDSDRDPNIRTVESGNLRSDADVLKLDFINSVNNNIYKQLDTDKDGVPNIFDNCVFIANSDQKDINNNNLGDSCEDYDKDGIINNEDNCPNNPNRSQRDIDKDGIGDTCDEEESRLTEKHKWIPWAGIGFALIVIIVLFIITIKSDEKDNI